MDGFEQAVAEPERARLTYPFDQAPEYGEAIDVAPGVKWLRLPLPPPLNFINVWAIAEAGGWAIVDLDTREEVVQLAKDFVELHRKHLGDDYEMQSEVRPIQPD